MNEIWKPVELSPFGEKYSVSNLGRIKPNQVSRYSSNGAKVLNPAKHPKGYMCVTMYACGKSKWSYVHNLVAAAFLEPPKDGKGKVLHKDDNKENNRADNLYYGDALDNFRDAVRNNGHDNKRTRNGNAKLTEAEIVAIRSEYSCGHISQQSLADKYGVVQTAISRIVRKQHWPD